MRPHPFEVPEAIRMESLGRGRTKLVLTTKQRSQVGVKPALDRFAATSERAHRQFRAIMRLVVEGLASHENQHPFRYFKLAGYQRIAAPNRMLKALRCL